MIYTFYSYKGGVGRSMALVNIARLFYEGGKKVLMVDWDLEAPGLEHFFFKDDELNEALKKPGVIDMLLAYKQKASTFSPTKDERLFPVHKLEDFVIPIYPSENKKDKKSEDTKDKETERWLWLLPAGQREPDKSESYANKVQNFDWIEFYNEWEGEIYFEKLRQLFEDQADVILIDTRTGITDMGGVCTYQLANAVIMFCAANNQNLTGTLHMLKSFNRVNLVEQKPNEPLIILPIPARIEKINELASLNRFRGKFDKQFKNHIKKIPKLASGFPTDLEIPYVPRYAFEEIIAVEQDKKNEVYSPELIEVYKKLLGILFKLIPPNKADKFPEKTLATALNFEGTQTWRDNLTKGEAELLEEQKKLKRLNKEQQEELKKINTENHSLEASVKRLQLLQRTFISFIFIIVIGVLSWGSLLAYNNFFTPLPTVNDINIRLNGTSVDLSSPLTVATNENNRLQIYVTDSNGVTYIDNGLKCDFTITFNNDISETTENQFCEYDYRPSIEPIPQKLTIQIHAKQNQFLDPEPITLAINIKEQ